MLAAFCLVLIAAAPDLEDIEELPLDELLSPQLDLASRRLLSQRSAPGIITVVTHEEIEHSGASSLFELLHLVPGFAFGVDVEGGVGAGFRGIWGHEGKILLLVDGLEINETIYSTFTLGQRLPASLIERVEVIRGPGSVVYGGYAELAVINVVTRGARDLKGGEAQLRYGQWLAGPGGVDASFAYGDDVGEHGSLIVLGAFSRGQRSDADYVDFTGARYPMYGNSELQTGTAMLTSKWREHELRFFFESHHADSRDANGPALDQPSLVRFTTAIADARSSFALGQSVKLLPRLEYKYTAPWQTLEPESPIFYDKSAQRLHASLALSWQIADDVDLLAGAEAIYDHATLNSPPDDAYQRPFGDALSVDYGTGVGFAQLSWRRFVDITVGARYEHHSLAGGSFVPRVAVTRVFDRVHFKLLFSQAFRAPGIENLALDPELSSERTAVAEAEVGVRPFERLQLTVNGFWGRIDQPIVYGNDGLGNELYVNANRLGTAGVEAEARFLHPLGFITLAYSFYTAARQSQVEAYAVPDDTRLLRGMPAHKLSVNSRIDLWRNHLCFSATLVLMSQRAGSTSGDGDGNGVLGTEPPILLVGLGLFLKDLPLRGLEIGVGVRNLLGSPYRLLQPYDDVHAPLPVMPRELWFSLAYHFSPRS